LLPAAGRLGGAPASSFGSSRGRERGRRTRGQGKGAPLHDVGRSRRVGRLPELFARGVDRLLGARRTRSPPPRREQRRVRQRIHTGSGLVRGGAGRRGHGAAQPLAARVQPEARRCRRWRGRGSGSRARRRPRCADERGSSCSPARPRGWFAGRIALTVAGLGAEDRARALGIGPQPGHVDRFHARRGVTRGGSDPDLAPRQDRGGSRSQPGRAGSAAPASALPGDPRTAAESVENRGNPTVKRRAEHAAPITTALLRRENAPHQPAQ
jgi:hypothetical protein